jgi:hypothetical protein
MNRQEAIQWCNKYLKRWPDVDDDLSKIATPLGGWKWVLKRLPYDTVESVVLLFNFTDGNGSMYVKKYDTNFGPGRPRGEGGKQMRIPTSLIKPVEKLIAEYRCTKSIADDFKKWLKNQ